MKSVLELGKLWGFAKRSRRGLANAIGRIAGSRKLDKTRFRGSLEGLGALGRLGLEGLLLFVYPNLLCNGSIYHLEGGGEVFRRVLRFPLR